jgi:multisubunit Na+/H+ antiporter MnhF subunit
MATATKNFGVLLVALLILAHALTCARARVEARPQPATRVIALRLAVVPIGFLLAAPSVLVSVGSFLEHVLYDFEKLRPRPPGADWARMFVFHARHTMAEGFGSLPLLLALAGLVPLARRGQGGLFLALSCLLLGVPLFATRFENARYGIPFLVLLSIPAGVSLGAVWLRLRRPLALAITLVAMAPSLFRSLSFDRVLGRPDTRVEMLAVLRQRGEPAADVLAVGWPLDLPIPERGSAPPPFHLYSRRFDSEPLVDPLTRLPNTILLSASTPRAEIPQWPALRERISRDYREVLRLEIGADPVGLLAVHGGTRALRISYDTPWRQTRPGPALVLYERIGAGRAAPACAGTKAGAWPRIGPRGRRSSETAEE